MIERGKVVALPKTATRDGEDVDRDAEIRRCARYASWGWLPYSKTDLEETLQAWHELIQAVNARRPGTDSVLSPATKGLFEEGVLRSAGVRKGGFAWEFYTSAAKPDFRYLGPGLTVPSPEQLVANVSAAIRDASNDPPSRPKVSPLPILVGDQLGKPWVFDNDDQFDPMIPWGVHLDHYKLESLAPFEDGCVLALPYKMYTVGDKLNRTPAGESTELYQIGWNSFMPKHSTQLLTVLRNFTTHVASGQCKVGCDGVDEPDTKFMDIDWDEKWYWDGDGHLEVLAHVVEGIYDGAWEKSLDEH
jgi:hypothetical protein